MPPTPVEQTSTSEQPSGDTQPSDIVPDVSAPEGGGKPPAEERVADYTYALTVFTAILAVATFLLGLIAFVQVLYFARKERAFVFQDGIDLQFIRARDGHTREWAFAVSWKNSGSTPTSGMRYRVTYDLTDTPLPRGHSFANKQGEEDRYAVMGPGGVANCLPIEIHVVDIEQVQLRKKHLYIWGWAEYRTVFWFSRIHRTEFCIEVVVQPVAGGEHRVGMPVHSEHNSAS